MSASTPIRNASSRCGSRLTRAKQGPFWGISIAVHCIVLGALVIAFPVREIVFRRDAPREPEIITRGDALQEIIDAIRDRTAERLRGRVALLEQGQDRMAQNFQIINTHFLPFADQQRATARARLDECIRQALDRQKALADALRAAQASHNPLPAVEAARADMPRILTAQDEIRRGIILLDLQKDALATQQNAAQEAQISANQFIRWLDDAVLTIQQRAEPLRSLRKELEDLELSLPGLEDAERSAFAAATNAEARVRLCDQQRRDTERLIRAAQDDARRLKAQQDKLERSLREANQQAKQRKKGAAPDTAKIEALTRGIDDAVAGQKQAKARLDSLKQQESGLKTQRGTLENTAAELKRTAAKARDESRNALRTAEDMRKRAERDEADLARTVTNRASLLVTSCNIQSGAYAAQQRVVERIRELLAGGTNAGTQAGTARQ
ncbi:hypothetical protein GX586_04575 [bacterium]|nr:hypothetical protein [bacterium]